MLTIAAFVVVVNITFGMLSPVLARGLTPWAAARLISCVAFVTTLASGFVVTAVAFDFVTQLPPVAALGSWSVASLRSADPVSTLVGVGATAAALLALSKAAGRIQSLIRDHVDAARTCRSLAGSRSEPVVQVDEQPDAFALFGPRGGRIVVTSALVAAVDGPELEVILAHEDSHLRHHHHLYLALAHLAAAANPAIRVVREVVALAVERWADEDAAAAVDDRLLAARAVARAGLARHRAAGAGASSAALAVAGSAVRHRADALLRPRPRTNPAAVLAISLATLLSGLGALSCERQTEHRFERAHVAYTYEAARAWVPSSPLAVRAAD